MILAKASAYHFWPRGVQTFKVICIRSKKITNKKRIMLSFTALKLMWCTSQKQQTVYELVKTFMLSCFARVHLYLCHSDFVTEGIVVLQEKVMQNFPNYINSEGEQTFNTLEELKELRFKKKRIFSSTIIEYSFLSYTSLQTYKLIMKDFSFPYLPLLKKNHWGATWCCELCQNL